VSGTRRDQATVLDLGGFVASLGYKPGWVFKLAGPLNRYLCVHATTPDSNEPARSRTTQHQFEIPADVSDYRTLSRWVFDCLLLCELHEAGEFFAVDGFRPFMPHHQDEGSPYDLVDRWEARYGSEGS
jgi:hypothetical protein